MVAISARKRSPAMTTRSRLSREEKLTKFQELAKHNNSKTGRVFADSFNKAHLLIDHPHSYRDWDIVAPDDVCGFYHLESRFRLNPGENPALYTTLTLCLHEANLKGSGIENFKFGESL
jgi:hypothetical protein